MIYAGQKVNFTLEISDDDFASRLASCSSPFVWHRHLDCNGHHRACITTCESSKPHDAERALPQDGFGNAISLDFDLDRIFIQLPRVIYLGDRRSTWLHGVVDGNVQKCRQVLPRMTCPLLLCLRLVTNLRRCHIEPAELPAILVFHIDPLAFPQACPQVAQL